MSTPTKDDLDALPEGDLLALPDEAIPAGWLTEFFARWAALIHQRDTDELARRRINRLMKRLLQSWRLNWPSMYRRSSATMTTRRVS